MPMPGQQMELELLADIAIGGTARVELCRAHGEGHAGRLVAVKRLHPQLAREAGVVDGLLADVWQASALHHANVVEVLGLASDERGPWVAYELVQCVSLARLMKTVAKTGESFHERMAVYIGWCIARGLSAAQRLRMPDGGSVELVHRDLLPESVLVGFAGEVKITDFGWARTKRRVGGSMAGAAVRRGSMLVSPEEIKGLEVDHRADLFSLGALLYELVGGRAPWEADAPLDLLRRVVEQDPPPLRSLRPGIDEELSSVVMRCLDRDPRARFQHAGAVLVRLEAWMAAHGYDEDNRGALSRFVRRNAMKQMQWFERALSAPPEATEARRPSLARMRAPSVPPKGAEIESSVTTDERPAKLRGLRTHDEQSPAELEAPPELAPSRYLPDGAQASAEDERAAIGRDESLPAPAPSTKWMHQLPEPSASPPSAPGEDTVVEAPSAIASLALPDDDPSESEMTTQALRRARRGETRPASPNAVVMAPSAPVPPAPAAPSPAAPVVSPSAPPVVSRSAPPAAMAPPARTAPSAPPPRGRPSATPPPAAAGAELTEDELVREADRLQLAAMRRAEEAQAAALVARAANERAQRAAVIAKKAHEAAVLAREAAKALNKFGQVESARKLERARAIERSYEAIETRTPSVPPPPAEPVDRAAPKPR